MNSAPGSAPRIAVDLVLLSRAEELLRPDRRPVLARMLLPEETDACTRGGVLDASAVAGVLAVKEAVFKLFHVRDRPLPWLSIQVAGGAGTWPVVHLNGAAAQLAEAARLKSGISVSLAHDGAYAVAVAAAVHTTEGTPS
ncbi:4'-phosphopantetheinyl transferase superfamily protein [Streptomyces sp. NPDC047072]|uniref:4'-phosphopantetheinyl transferase superfamily protein n=1 Tax=Streptomyces sp. NPDC047072 TaxID=3154809 RepID=UPI0033FA6528